MYPCLLYTSSFAFLSPQEQNDLRLDPVTRELDTQVLVHETAHQWWGDLVLWKSYRDQWFAEGLANYASLLLLEQQKDVYKRQDHDSGLNSPPRDHLGALFNRCIQKLAETRLSVLYLP